MRDPVAHLAQLIQVFEVLGLKHEARLANRALIKHSVFYRATGFEPETRFIGDVWKALQAVQSMQLGEELQEDVHIGNISLKGKPVLGILAGIAGLIEHKVKQWGQDAPYRLQDTEESYQEYQQLLNNLRSIAQQLKISLQALPKPPSETQVVNSISKIAKLLADPSSRAQAGDMFEIVDAGVQETLRIAEEYKNTIFAQELTKEEHRAIIDQCKEQLSLLYPEELPGATQDLGGQAEILSESTLGFIEADQVRSETYEQTIEERQKATQEAFGVSDLAFYPAAVVESIRTNTAKPQNTELNIFIQQVLEEECRAFYVSLQSHYARLSDQHIAAQLTYEVCETDFALIRPWIELHRAVMQKLSALETTKAQLLAYKQAQETIDIMNPNDGKNAPSFIEAYRQYSIIRNEAATEEQGAMFFHQFNRWRPVLGQRKSFTQEVQTPYLFRPDVSAVNPSIQPFTPEMRSILPEEVAESAQKNAALLSLRGFTRTILAAPEDNDDEEEIPGAEERVENPLAENTEDIEGMTGFAAQYIAMEREFEQKYNRKRRKVINYLEATVPERTTIKKFIENLTIQLKAITSPRDYLDALTDACKGEGGNIIVGYKDLLRGEFIVHYGLFARRCFPEGGIQTTEKGLVVENAWSPMTLALSHSEDDQRRIWEGQTFEEQFPDEEKGSKVGQQGYLVDKNFLKELSPAGKKEITQDALQILSESDADFISLLNAYTFCRQVLQEHIDQRVTDYLLQRVWSRSKYNRRTGGIQSQAFWREQVLRAFEELFKNGQLYNSYRIRLTEESIDLSQPSSALVNLYRQLVQKRTDLANV